MFTGEVLNLIDDLTLGMKFKKLMDEHSLTLEDLTETPQKTGRNSIKQTWYEIAEKLDNEDLVTLLFNLHQKDHLPTILNKAFGRCNELPDTFTFLFDYVGRVNSSKLVGLNPSSFTKQAKRLDEDRNKIISYIQEKWIKRLLTSEQRQRLEKNIQNQKLNDQRVNSITLEKGLVAGLTYDAASSSSFTEKEFEKARQFCMRTINYNGMSDLVRQFVTHTYGVDVASADGICSEVRNRLSTKLNNVQDGLNNIPYKLILHNEPHIILWAFGLILDIREYSQRCCDLSIKRPISAHYSSPNKACVEGLASILEEILTDTQSKNENWFNEIIDTFGTRTKLISVLSSYFQHRKLSNERATAKSEVEQAIIYKFSERDGRVSNKVSQALLVKCGMHMHALKKSFGLTDTELRMVIPLILNSEHLSVEEAIELIRCDKKIKALNESNEQVEVDIQKLAYEIGINTIAIKNRINELQNLHGGRNLDQIPHSLEIISRQRNKSIKKRNNRRNSDTLGSFYVAGIIRELNGEFIEMIKIGWTEFDVANRLESICEKQPENIGYGLILIKTFYICQDSEIPVSYDLEQKFKRQLIDLKIQRPFIETNAHGKEEIFLFEDIKRNYPQILEEEFAKKKFFQLYVEKKAR